MSRLSIRPCDPGGYGLSPFAPNQALDVIRLATRPSELALIQAGIAQELIRRRVADTDVSIVAIRSQGDIEDRTPVRRFGDKAVFVARIEQAVQEGQADVAVHSLKDVPGAIAPGLWLCAYLRREDPRDVFVSISGTCFDQLPGGSRIGTSSARRIRQLRAIRSDLDFIDIRGNVDTRLRRLRSGEYDGIVLAAAGLIRLGLSDVITEFLDPAVCTPAPGQGIIVLECRENYEFGEELGQAGDPEAALAASVERSLAVALGATCMTPFGALARVEGDRLRVDACLGTASTVRRASVEGARGDWPHMLREAAARLRE